MCNNRLDSQNDSINLLSNFPENGNRWLAANDVMFPERYIKGEIDIVFKFCIGGCASKYDLVFFSVPGRLHDGTVAANDHLFKMRSINSYSDGNNNAMFVDIAKPIQGENEIISSFVRIERATERYDIRWDIFASSFDNIVEFSGGIGDGEVGLPRVRLPRRDASCKGGLVKCGPETFDSFDSEVGKTNGKLFGEYDFVQFINSVNIVFNNSGIWLFFEELVDPSIECIDVFLCARKSL